MHRHSMNTNQRYAVRIIPIMLMVFAMSCAPTSRLITKLTEDPASINQLKDRIQSDPNDVEALSWLGYVYLSQDSLALAQPLLNKAYEQDPSFPGVAYIFGLYSEKEGEYERASNVYNQYMAENSRSSFRKLVRARQEFLQRREVRLELISRVANEDTLSSSPNTVAVFPLQFQGTNERYAPLGRGLSAMVTYDLGFVQDLVVLERLRMDVLTEELELARSGLVLDDTAPRLGLILGAGRVIGGTYDVAANGDLRVDMAIQQTEEIQLTNLLTQSVDMNEFFRMQKDLVFQLLDEMNIQVTEAERDQIETIPTRNLQAFLAYSQGLQEEDAGRFGEAAALFRQAQSLDPNFQPAVDQTTLNEGLDAAGGELDEAIAAAESAADEIDLEGNTLVRSRHLNQGESLGTLMVPGQDAREPANEAASAFTDGSGGPPLPPPTGSNN